MGGFKSTKLWAVLVDIFDWYPSHYSATERSLLRKIDWTILTFASISYFAKLLDTNNLNNAYVSGMKEDLNLGGNDLNYLTMAYNGAYVVGQIPLTALLTRSSLAPYVLPGIEVVWTLLTFVTIAVKNKGQLYVVRALVGFSEAPCYAGIHFILGSWYRKEELFKRAGVWFTMWWAGSIASGYLQAAAYKNLNGVDGFAGWRWLFIIDACITAPCAILGLLTFPGIPTSRRKKYLYSEEEWALATSRLTSDHKSAGPLNFDVIKRTLKQPMWYIAVLCYICLLQSGTWSSYMNLWLKAENRYSVEMINIYPTFSSVIAVFVAWIGTTLAGSNIVKPWAVFYATQIPQFIAVILLCIWKIPRGVKFMCYYLSGLGGATSPILYSWVNITMRKDPEQRALILSSMMTAGFASNLFIPLLAYPTKEAPRYPKGYPTSIAFNILYFIVWGAGFYLYRNSNTQVGNDDDAVSEGESADAKSIEEKSIGEVTAEKSIGEAAPVAVLEKQ